MRAGSQPSALPIEKLFLGQRSSSTARRCLGLGLLACVACAVGQNAKEQSSYFEFGTITAIGSKRVEVQTFNQQTGRFEHHSFAVTRETRAEAAHVGEQVEVIFAAYGEDWTLRRLVVLHDGIPTAGSPVGGQPLVRSVPPASATARTDLRGNVTAPAPIVRSANLGRNTSAVSLASKNAAKPVAVVPVPAIVAPKVPTPVVLSVARDTPSAECRQSDPNWANEPLSLAVLDFRYPTEREEAHDIGTTGGGSGTALADIIFERLKRQPEFTVDRGDRRRLDRGDIAGAAKIGRELGVDAVIEGTFWPVDEPVKGYELRAGLVDTCTGQVLMKMTSEVCPAAAGISAGSQPGPAAASTPVCEHLSVSAKEAESPDESSRAFDPAIAALLFPLEHNRGAGKVGTAGKVSGTTKDSVIVMLGPGARVKVGDQLAVHASRLAKNPTTYTLQELKDQEIGRLTVRSVQGAMAVGSYSGDIFPKAGDTADLVTE